MRTLNSRLAGLLNFRAWCWLLVLTAAPQSFGNLMGVESEIRTDMTLCQDTRQDFIDEPLIVALDQHHMRVETVQMISVEVFQYFYVLNLLYGQHIYIHHIGNPSSDLCRIVGIFCSDESSHEGSDAELIVIECECDTARIITRICINLCTEIKPGEEIVEIEGSDSYRHAQPPSVDRQSMRLEFLYAK